MKIRLLASLAMVFLITGFGTSFGQVSAGDSELDKLRAEYPAVIDQIVLAKGDSNQLDAAYLKFQEWDTRAARYPELYAESYQARFKIYEAWEGAVELAASSCWDDFTQLAVLRAWHQWPKDKPGLTQDGFFSADRAIQAMRDCANFKVGFESAFTVYYDEGLFELTTASQYALQTVVDEQTGLIHLNGQGPLDYTKMNFPPADEERCQTHTSGIPGTFIVQDATLEFVPAALDGKAPKRGIRPALRQVTGSFQILNPGERFMVSCPEGHFEQIYTHWASFWKAMHPGNQFGVDDWELGLSEVFARKNYKKFINGQFEEKTVIQLEHGKI